MLVRSRIPQTRTRESARESPSESKCQIWSTSCQQSRIGYWGRNMGGGRPPAFNPFTCPNCGAYYQVVKVEAGPETTDREITCQVCGGSLVGREGKFVLKYFLVRKGTSSRRQARLNR